MGFLLNLLDSNRLDRRYHFHKVHLFHKDSGYMDLWVAHSRVQDFHYNRGDIYTMHDGSERHKLHLYRIDTVNCIYRLYKLQNWRIRYPIGILELKLKRTS